VQWWHYAIWLFIGSWFLQIALSFLQVKHYQQTVRSMAAQNSGYLGVGVVKKKFGIGSVVILVTNRDLVVTQAQELTGVTVFRRFRRMEPFLDRHIDEIANLTGEDSRTGAIRIAVQKIRQQVA
jgi:glucitol operon activator protein